MRWTPLRQEIFELVKAMGKPINAHTIDEKIKNFDLSNIYRSLNCLEAEGYIASVAIKGTSYYFIGAGHFPYCKTCKELKEFNKCVGSSLIESLESEHDFNITNHTLLFEGQCKRCKGD